MRLCISLTTLLVFFSVKAPTGLQAPTQLVPLPGGTTVMVTWAPPQRPNGVLTEYRILSYRVHPLQVVPGETVVSDISILNTTISGLQPYTTYEIKIQAFTVGRSSIGPDKNVTTDESGILNELFHRMNCPNSHSFQTFCLKTARVSLQNNAKLRLFYCLKQIQC